MKRMKAIISYEGTNISGWQKQIGQRSVQENIEKALFNVLREHVDVYGSGRTDAGVHANGQSAHFDIKDSCNLNTKSLRNAINFHLNEDIRVLSIDETSFDFHARKSAKSKTYSYFISNSSSVSPLYRRFVTQVNRRIDLDKVKEVLPVFIGKRDFKAFANKNNEGVASYSSVRTIFDFYFSVLDNGVIKFTINGDGFLYKMVRNIIGSVVYYASGKISIDDIEKAFGSGDRKLSGPSMPAKGLILEKVFY